MPIAPMEQRLTDPQRKGRGPRRQQADMAFPRVAETLRELRVKAGLTQEQFAAKVGLTFAGYRPYERGARDLTYTQIDQFARELGVPVSEITRRLWPDDAQLVETRFSTDEGEILRETAHLAPELRESVLRTFRLTLEIANAASDLARRN